MRSLQNYINEKGITPTTTILETVRHNDKKYFPTNKDELISIIDELGHDRTHFNDIDTSKITDMSEVFYRSEFNGDISGWDTSNVVDMSWMFAESKFNNLSIKGWDISNVQTMEGMFSDSRFIKNISEHWNISETVDTYKMFENVQHSEIPLDSGVDENTVERYTGKDLIKAEYFGDCRNTVDIDKMWDANQMASFISTCELYPVEKFLDIAADGDRRIPKPFTRNIERLKRENKLNDVSEVICAVDNKEQYIGFIYLTDTDIHYFFDIK